MPCKKRGSKSKSTKKTSSRKAKAKKTEKSKIEALDVDEDAKKILKALERIGKPAKCGEIAKEAGFSTQKVAAKMRSLARKGIVKRSEEGLYSLAL
ncbi:MAG: hypothetical protein QI197_05730 [Candidatus Korarchaeota archaeon]|nr:hypothetical protein [Candidatus Korarchaeota archaeon]